MASINSLDLAVLRRLLAQRQMVNDNIYNVAKAMLKEGTTIRYRVNERDYFGSVVQVIGIPSTTRVRVKNLHTLKERDIQLGDITGLVQEN